MAAMAMDRYYSVRRATGVMTRGHPGMVNPWMIYVLPCAIWIAALVLAIPIFIFYDIAPYPRSLLSTSSPSSPLTVSRLGECRFWSNVWVAPGNQTDYTIPTCSFPVTSSS